MGLEGDGVLYIYIWALYNYIFRLQLLCITVMVISRIWFQVFSSVQAFAVNGNVILGYILVKVKAQSHQVCCTEKGWVEEHVAHVMFRDVVLKQCKLNQYLKIQSMQINIQLCNSLYFVDYQAKSRTLKQSRTHFYVMNCLIQFMMFLHCICI